MGEPRAGADLEAVILEDVGDEGGGARLARECGRLEHALPVRVCVAGEAPVRKRRAVHCRRELSLWAG